MRGPHATTPASEEPSPRVAFPSFTNPCNPPPLHDKYICNRSSGAQLSSSRRRSNASTSSYMTTTEAGSTEEVAFQVFPWIWLQLMQCVLDGLVDVPREPVHEAEHRALVAEVIDHHASYFLIKSILALRDPAFVLYPPWLSVLARALLWMGGWRPTAALRLVPAGILSAEQAWALEAIRQVARAEVAVVEEEMRRVQIEGVVGLMMAGRAAVAAVADAEKAAIERMLARQWTVAVVADSLRMKVLRRVVAVLSPLQAVDFLAAVVRMEISMHQM